MSRRKCAEPLYKVTEKLLCKSQGQLYDAVILETKGIDILEKEKSVGDESDDTVTIRSMSTEGSECSDKFAYYLHYVHWNSRWDEWVRSDCLVAVTEETRQRQQELKLAARKEKNRRSSQKKRRRSGRKSVPSSSVNGNQDEDLIDGRVSETLESQEPMDEYVSSADNISANEDELRRTSKKRRRRVDRKSDPSLSVNDKVDEDLSEVGSGSETLESQEPMDDKAVRKADLSLSANDKVDEDLSEVGSVNETLETQEPMDDKAVRKSDPTLSVNDKSDEDLSEVGSDSETWETQEPRDSKVSKVDDVCEDKDELTNERAEDSGLCQAEENGNDSTKTIANTETEIRTPNNNLSNEDSAVRRENCTELGKASEEKATMDYNLVNLDAAGTEEKEMKDPEELNTSENKVESAPASGTTSSSTSFEGEERIKEGERSNGNVSPCESTVAAAREVESATANQPHLGEKVEKIVTVLHPCSVIGTPTVKEILPQLRDHLESLDYIPNGPARAFVEKVENVYEDVCRDIVHQSLKCEAEQAMSKIGSSKYSVVVHFSGLVELINVMESGEWTNPKYYKPQEDGQFVVGMNLIRKNEACMVMLGAAKRFLLSELTERNHVFNTEGNKDQEMTVSEDNSIKSSYDIDGERPVACPSPKHEGTVKQDEESAPEVTPPPLEKVGGDDEASEKSEYEMDEDVPHIEHPKNELLDKIPEINMDGSSSREIALLDEMSEKESVDVRGSTHIPIREHSPARTMRSRRSLREVETAEEDYSNTSKKTRLTRQRKINTGNQGAGETAATKRVVGPLPVQRKRKSEPMVPKTGESSLNDDSYEDRGRVGGKRASVRRKCVNYK